MMTDPIGDLATRIRNGLQNEATHVDVPTSKLKLEVAAALQREGFIWDFESHANEGTPGGTLRINLKYGPSGERVVRSIRRVSKPGRRIYFKCETMPKILGGMGVLVLSTNQGVLSDREAKCRKIGGEALLEIW
ncbi:MAG: 30S ribosomal protein S8 [Planctomycetaceae bacterium]